MNPKLQARLENWKGKRIAVLGIGVSNRPLVRLLLDAGLDVTACDRVARESAEEAVLQFERDGARLHLGEGYLDGLDADVIFRTPGLRPDLPQICRAVSGGALLTSEMELFFDVCPARIIAVTGSDGKTTTTTLIAEMLKQAGYRVFLGGNIGQPLLPLVSEMTPSDFAVVELSSFQLMTMKRSPLIAVVTNVTRNHMDVHKSMEEYVDAKRRVFLGEPQPKTVVLNADNEITASFASDVRGELRTFSRKAPTDNGAFIRENSIVSAKCGDCSEVLQTEEILIPGMHNVENYMAAYCAVRDYVSEDDLRTVARHFRGVEHRIEPVRTLRGVRYFNDSIASSPTRTIAGLHSFDRKVILIAGGYDKKIPFSELGSEICCHVKTLVLCGATADAIETAVLNAPEYGAEHPEILKTDDFYQAVLLAQKAASDGDVVTLSPACAAFDRFKNFMERGKTFKKIVMELV